MDGDLRRDDNDDDQRMGVSATTLFPSFHGSGARFCSSGRIVLQRLRRQLQSEQGAAA
eukprot:CAMPEP_0183421194 /NCGR_PEP_ID=MMETSP0370-20130417/26934_1 /TAXON_ID=268820 /ORGANISM="Peridinium aciculiferum, Strain PAER-2" /LENGTH=57 /DNA_ID=CAMNT_0025605151 /DNA_START=1 /DNA_END=170 /DNA_ORIENTATION=-